MTTRKILDTVIVGMTIGEPKANSDDLQSVTLPHSHRQVGGYVASATKAYLLINVCNISSASMFSYGRRRTRWNKGVTLTIQGIDTIHTFEQGIPMVKKPREPNL